MPHNADPGACRRPMSVWIICHSWRGVERSATYRRQLWSWRKQRPDPSRTPMTLSSMVPVVQIELLLF